MCDGTASPSALIGARQLRKTYLRGRQQVSALVDINLEIHAGEFVALTGPSGSGKTTLLNLVGCMDEPTSGTLRIGGREVQRFTDRERTDFRRERIGFIFQHFGLIPTLNVVENIALPLMFSGRAAGPEVENLVERVQLQHRREHYPNQLSGGEMQRVAVARALVQRPDLLLADEPTGNLDSATGESLMGLFKELHSGGLTILLVTHNPLLAEQADRCIRLRDGRIV